MAAIIAATVGTPIRAVEVAERSGRVLGLADVVEEAILLAKEAIDSRNSGRRSHRFPQHVERQGQRTPSHAAARRSASPSSPRPATISSKAVP